MGFCSIFCSSSDSRVDILLSGWQRKHSVSECDSNRRSDFFCTDVKEVPVKYTRNTVFRMSRFAPSPKLYSHFWQWSNWRWRFQRLSTIPPFFKLLPPFIRSSPNVRHELSLWLISPSHSFYSMFGSLLLTKTTQLSTKSGSSRQGGKRISI